MGDRIAVMRHGRILQQGTPEELYDHRTDPHEWNNLAGNPEFAQTLMNMRKSLTSSKTQAGSRRRE